MNQTPRDILDTVLGHLGFHSEIEESEHDGHRILQVRTADPRPLIGPRGETLESLQILVNRLLSAGDKDAPRVIVDVEFHRAMREDAFLARIRHLADAVRENGKPVETEPLNSYERRLVHDAYRADPELETQSQQIDAKLKRILIKRRSAA
jgi:spoIIIJ-associated protein